MSERLHVFGIRHHGPGSSASLVRALDALDPEELLIEGPPEGTPLIPWISSGMVPPVAILVYAAEEPGRAAFYPFAEWSPEWQAMRWALDRGRPVRFADLPVGAKLAPQDDDPETDVRGDPLTRLAEIAGQPDGEAWWNALVEESAGDAELFAAIEDAMAALRAETPEIPSDERREAHMRAAIDDALGRTAGPVAAVVGAWHAPALRGGVRKGDAAHLKAAKKAEKVAVTWVPWTDSRLTMASGYGAGVRAPGWYRALWESRESASTRDLAVHWQTKVAHALRDHGRPAATSSVIDAVRLVEALTAVRELARPGLDEMRDASLATLCHGEEVPWRLISREILEGTRIGVVPDEVPSTPLAADLARHQKLLKLKPEADPREMSLDLRSDAGGAKSRLLHRLAVLDVDWGKLAEAGGSRGTFRESWVLQWRPELSVKLAEALRWGTTIEAAATARLAHDLTNETELVKLAESVRSALLADLGGAVDEGVRRIDAVATAGADVVALARSVPPLTDVLRYGTAREMRLEGVDVLVDRLLDKVLVGVQLAARHLDDEAAAALRDALGVLDPALRTYRENARGPDWIAALDRVATDDEAAPLVAGWATRRLHDEAAWPGDRIAARLSATLSPGVPLPRAAAWLEGFLGEAAHILLHDVELLAIVDDWLVSLSEGALIEALPLLRRATAAFGASERSRLLKVVAGEGRAAVTADVPTGSPAFLAAIPLLSLILEGT